MEVSEEIVRMQIMLRTLLLFVPLENTGVLSILNYIKHRSIRLHISKSSACSTHVRLKIIASKMLCKIAAT